MLLSLSLLDFQKIPLEILYSVNEELEDFSNIGAFMNYVWPGMEVDMTDLDCVGPQSLPGLQRQIYS